ncbi:PREDICTED: uncharacterized protein LOC109129165 [Camelina sativa]|uniref:Uncharacterized protein LOC109129165 n=1 Tax=Camelina sativa TaxID=90675 RepID=A0ABM1R027_CAMSA|nr:PREDICTED: uncharacterized protein LOC109129165 [Camelina sativa]
MDVHNTFLHGDLTEEVYMKPPPGYFTNDEKKSLSDNSLFFFDKGGVRINILIYVDDMIVTSNSNEALTIFKGYLATCLKMKDLGPLKYLLGIEVSRSSQGFYLNQRKYALEIVADTGLLGCKPNAFPLEQNHNLALSKTPLLPAPEPYRRLLGRLIYLVATRPDLAYCVHFLAQFMKSPREAHWEAALRV